MDPILVVNAGSSSVKFEVFAVEGAANLKFQIKGQIDGIGTQPRLRARGADGAVLIEQRFETNEVPDVPAALQTAAGWLSRQYDIAPVAVGHRVVHGGPNHDRPVVVDADVLAELEQYVCLAPLHQPNNLAPIRSISERFPQLLQVACFDTAFHRKHSAIGDHYAIPEQFYAQGIRRYGFHGLSYEYIAQRLPDVAPDIADKRVIVAHLGSGASMCALVGGRSVESTMGFTALDGLPMGTRPGQLDPGVVLFLIEQQGMTPAAVQKMLYAECGLKGLSGISNDVRDLEASNDPRAAFALDHLVYRIGLHAGMLAAALGGLDGFVFTAGIGENSVSLRARIAEKLDWLGAKLDANANTARGPCISRPGSRIALYVIPTNEELMIARHTLALVADREALGRQRKALQ
jgi:acetate kinase